MSIETEKELIRIRHELHAIPEHSGQERKTKQWIRDYLTAHTSFEVLDCGEGLCAVKRPGNREDNGAETVPSGTTAASSACPPKGGAVSETRRGAIAFRADYDAVALPDGRAAHLCGHDGHTTVLLGLALYLEEHPQTRPVVLIFQPAEETGQGAESMTSILKAEHVTEIYGSHNLPGLPFGKVYTTSGTFACASSGMIISLKGKPAHAAYPENGISPADTVADILSEVGKVNREKTFGEGSICTVIGTSMGQKAFGTAAENAELWLTLRARTEAQFEALKNHIKDTAQNSSERDGLRIVISETDIFPATVNDPLCAEKVLAACDGLKMAEPMRWSEDFGYYLREVPGAFFGIGAGEDTPALHTASYEYPDSLLGEHLRAFVRLL